jgi:hypothetical protein
VAAHKLAQALYLQLSLTVCVANTLIFFALCKAEIGEIAQLGKAPSRRQQRWHCVAEEKRVAVEDAGYPARAPSKPTAS